MHRKLALRIAIRKVHRILDLKVVGIHVLSLRQEKSQMIRWLRGLSKVVDSDGSSQISSVMFLMHSFTFVLAYSPILVVSWSGTTNADYRPAAKWKALGDAIEEVVVWDSVYYMRIAECGYEYEQTHAFFPALPLLMHFVANTGECQPKQQICKKLVHVLLPGEGFSW